jgi:hypothetical protein
LPGLPGACSEVEPRGVGALEAPVAVAAACTVDALGRHAARDPSCTDVHCLRELVDMVSAFGPQDRHLKLGHPDVLARVLMYTTKFACPRCQPWEFGMSRAYLGSVVGRGQGRFDVAVEVVLAATGALEGVVPVVLSGASDGEGPVPVSQAALEEARERLQWTLLSARKGEKHPWFRQYK